MKSTAYIMMYSGMPNPEKELTDEEVSNIKGLVSELNIPFPGNADSYLGFSYSAFIDENLYVIASPCGYVKILNKSGLVTTFSDTTGVIAYLCKIMTPVMIKHQEEGVKIMKDWVASLPLYSPLPWEYNFKG